MQEPASPASPAHWPDRSPARKGENAADYLANGYIDEGGGYRSAYESPLPKPDYGLVERLLTECSESLDGTAVHAYAEQDLLIAATETASADVVQAELAKAMNATVPAAEQPQTMLGISFFDELVESATYRRISPSNFPIAPDLLWRLLERELHLIRVVNGEALAAAVPLDDGRTLTLTPRNGEHGFEVVVGGTTADQLVFTHEVAELCVWSPVSLESLRRSLVEQAKQTPAHLAALANGDISAVSAPGDNIAYTTLYKPPNRETTDQTPAPEPDAVANTGSDGGPRDTT